MRHMRDRNTYCSACCGTYRITADLDRGTVVMAMEPKACVSPAKCKREFTAGIFARQWSGKPKGAQ